jgi:2-oxoglutarate ferredoxin oxidoreductase subunit alpha
MNDHITEPLEWDDGRTYDRGKVLTAEELDRIYKGPAENGRPPREGIEATSRENGFDASDAVLSEMDAQPHGDHSPVQPLEQFKGKFGRYLDIDGDGVPYRTIPGTHVTRGAFTTRGSSRDEYAVYTEDGEAYRRNVDRLLRKWETAKELVPQPEFYSGDGPGINDAPTSSSLGVIFFGTSTYAAEEAIKMLAAEGVRLDAMRPRAFPFGRAFRDFVESHKRVFVIEQNRDAQFRSLMTTELGTDPAKLISVLNYDGMPITADNIFRQIRANCT